jgi:predicted transcriptional regulator
MKRTITVRLSEDMVERLEAAAERRGASKAALMEAALQRFLATESDTADDATLLRRMSGQLGQLDRDLHIVSETVALHARYHLSNTPPLPQAHQRTACALGRERFEAFATQVGGRLHLATSLMRETMDELTATNPGLFASEVEEVAPRPGAEPYDDASAPTVLNGELKSSAGVQEGASSDGFRGEARDPNR